MSDYLHTLGQGAIPGVTAFMERALNNTPEAKARNSSHREPVVQINPEMPWSDERMPTSILADLQQCRVRQDTTASNTLRLVLPDGTDGPTFDDEGLRALGHQAVFRLDFLKKLSGGTQVQVVNEMLEQHRKQAMQFAGKAGVISTVTPGWRELCSHAEIAQIAYDNLQQMTGRANVELYTADSAGMLLKVSSPLEKQITPAQGDALRFGLKVDHQYGKVIRVSLYVLRLICLNGMTAEGEEFSWVSKYQGGIQQQLDWVVMCVNEARSMFEAIVNKSKYMSTVQVTGNPEDALIVRAENMKIAPKWHQHLIAAFRQEPGDTEWHMLNALTRFATHNPELNMNQREALQIGCGEWTSKFDLVSARLPRSLAERFGAQILN